jgi:hypothetical protein
LGPDRGERGQMKALNVLGLLPVNLNHEGGGKGDNGSMDVEPKLVLDGEERFVCGCAPFFGIIRKVLKLLAAFFLFAPVSPKIRGAAVGFAGHRRLPGPSRAHGRRRDRGTGRPTPHRL